jgi:hydrogenase/urease accessory protein HupE
MTLGCAGFLAGFVYVLSGPDHLAAITPYAVKEKRSACRCGANDASDLS